MVVVAAGVWTLACLSWAMPHLAHAFNVPDCVKYGRCDSPKVPVLGGVDVVECFSLKEGSALVMGDDDFATDFGGYQFLFKDENNQNLFKTNPTAYIPQCGGFCAFGVACHGGHGVCTNTGPVDTNTTQGWTIHNHKLFFFNHHAKKHMETNSSLFEVAETQWGLWYPDPDAPRFNTDALWPFVDDAGESTCRTCGFEDGSSVANKLARNRKFFLGRSGAVSGLSPHFTKPFPHSIHSWHVERGNEPPLQLRGLVSPEIGANGGGGGGGGVSLVAPPDLAVSLEPLREVELPPRRDTSGALLPATRSVPQGRGGATAPFQLFAPDVDHPRQPHEMDLGDNGGEDSNGNDDDDGDDDGAGEGAVQGLGL